MFYVIIFSCLAVVLVIGGIATVSRRRARWDAEDAAEARSATTDKQRRNRKAERKQSQHDRRKRH